MLNLAEQIADEILLEVSVWSSKPNFDDNSIFVDYYFLNQSQNFVNYCEFLANRKDSI